MALTGWRYKKGIDVEDYTAGTAVNAGQIVRQGDTIGVAIADIAAGIKGSMSTLGYFNFPRDHTAHSAGDTAYLNIDGTPYNGTAGGGAITATVGSADNAVGRFVEAGGTNVTPALVDLNRYGAGDADADTLDSTAGTASGTLSAIAGTASGDTDVVINNNFSELATEVNAIKAILRANGIVKPA